MKAMRLTRNKHHRKLRAPIRDISDWLVNADVSDVAAGAAPCRVLAMYSAPEDRLPLVPRTTTCSLPRLPAASHDYLLPPTTNAVGAIWQLGYKPWVVPSDRASRASLPRGFAFLWPCFPLASVFSGFRCPPFPMALLSLVFRSLCFRLPSDSSSLTFRLRRLPS